MSLSLELESARRIGSGSTDQISSKHAKDFPSHMDQRLYQDLPLEPFLFHFLYRLQTKTFYKSWLLKTAGSDGFLVP